MVARAAEVGVVSIDKTRGLLVGSDGRSYREWEPNTWADSGEARPQVVYLGTGRHGGGIVLRPLFVRTSDGWVNATTGRPAPDHVRLP